MNRNVMLLPDMTVRMKGNHIAFDRTVKLKHPILGATTLKMKPAPLTKSKHFQVWLNQPITLLLLKVWLVFCFLVHAGFLGAWLAK